MRSFRATWLLAVLCVSLGLTACAQGGARGTDTGEAPVFSGDTEYTLGTGDRIRVIVYGEEELSGEFEIDGSGVVAYPLIGSIPASGKTLREFEGLVAAALQQGYIKDPKVSAEVINFRPFYIIGEVNKGGEYPYVNGMTVLNAVALAAGYTYRADQEKVYIQRAGTGFEVEYSLERPVPVFPGDIIRIAERFF